MLWPVGKARVDATPSLNFPPKAVTFFPSLSVSGRKRAAWPRISLCECGSVPG